MIKLLYYRHNLKHSHEIIQPHKITFNEITIVLDGVLYYKVNGKPITLNKGDVIFIGQGNTRYREPCFQTNYVSINFKSDKIVNLPVKIEDGLSHTIRNLISVFDDIYGYTNNLSDERFTLILSCFLVQLEKQIASQNEHPLVLQIKNYVRINLPNKITLSDISNHVNYSVAHCEMIFKKATGESIMDYVIKKRINTAKPLLIGEQLTLQDVAYTVGFLDYNYFSRAFKKHTGVSPLNYKKTHF
jgi:YesN/AraC family two-component response regulator